MLIDHGDRTSALYLHLAAGSISVAPRMKIAAGTLLSVAGATGWAAAVHLHFQAQAAPPPSRRKGRSWWWGESLPLAFDDPSVRAAHPDGVPVVSDRPYVSGNAPLRVAAPLSGWPEPEQITPPEPARLRDLLVLR